MNTTDRIPITTRDLDIPELISDVIDGDVDDNVASDDPLELRAPVFDIQATYGHSHIIPDMSRTLPNTLLTAATPAARPVAALSLLPFCGS